MEYFRKRIPALAIYAFLLAVWWLVTEWAWVQPIILPSPKAVASVMIQMFTSGGLLRDLAVTGGRVCAALVIAAAIGIPIGLFFGYQKRLYGMVEGPLHALRSVPATCLFPLLLIVIGVGEKSIITLAAYPCLLILMVNSATGASLAEPSRVRQGKVLGLSAFELVTEVLFLKPCHTSWRRFAHPFLMLWFWWSQSKCSSALAKMVWGARFLIISLPSASQKPMQK
jgi:ABC-type nitrate/sulfonate/bicarbonate transport system permease component